MDLETYRANIRKCDLEIDDINAEIRRLELQIEEAQSAVQSAKRVREDFERFVLRGKRSQGSQGRPNALHSFDGFIKKATNMLTGSEYLRASDQIDELSRVAQRKLRLFSDDLDYCKGELRRLRRKREALAAEYKLLLAEEEES